MKRLKAKNLHQAETRHHRQAENFLEVYKYINPKPSYNTSPAPSYYMGSPSNLPTFANHYINIEIKLYTVMKIDTEIDII